MLGQEIKTLKEFEKLNCITDTECLKILKKEYPKTFKKTLKELSNYTKDMAELIGCEPTEYSDKELLEMFDDDSIIDFFNDVYWEDNEKDIISNFYVTDTVGTDKGTYSMIIENGYIIGEC